MNETLFSGLLGAVLGSLVSIVYSGFTERYRRRTDALMSVVEWAEEVYERLHGLAPVS